MAKLNIQDCVKVMKKNSIILIILNIYGKNTHLRLCKNNYFKHT